MINHRGTAHETSKPSAQPVFRTSAPITPRLEGDTQLWGTKTLNLCQRSRANETWFAILWECKATRQIAGAVSRAYKQLDDYPNRLYFIANDRAAQFLESGNRDSRYAQILRSMQMEAKRRTNRIHYGVLIAHDAREKQPNLRDLHKHPEYVPPGCHHLIFVALPDFSDLRDAVWREMRLR